MPLTVGTAGHIDHGKTWLVRALTGKDTDRLPEEQRRGISIDLGYAPLELPDGRRLSLVDVPGHERFVRTMVAGATGIDLFLLVIDAGEGARPQTHEHLAILRLLGVERGVVAVTKVDAVDADTVELAIAGGGRARAGRGGGGRERQDGRGHRRAPRSARARCRDGGKDRSRSADPPLRRPCLHGPRHRHRRHGHASVGCDRCGRRARARALRAPRSRAQRPGARPGGRSRGVGAARRGEPSRSRADGSPAWRRPRRARRVPGLVSARRRARGDRAGARRRTRAGARRNVARRRAGRPSRRALGAAAARGARRRRQRGSGDPPRARRRSVAASSSIRPRHGIATRPAWRSSSGETRPRRFMLRSAPSRSLTSSTASRRASCGPGSGSSRPPGCRSSSDDLRERIVRADPLDPGISPPNAAWAADVVPLLPFELRGAKLYLPGAAPSLGGPCGRGRRSRGGAHQGGCAGNEGRRRAARRVPRARGSSRSARPGACRVAGGVRDGTRSRARRVQYRRRDHARALSRPARRGAARRAAPARASRP